MSPHPTKLFGLFTTLASDTFAICLLVAVTTAAFFAFVLEASGELVIILLGLGGLTAFFEARHVRNRKKGGRK
ncbi:hypothetical protein GGD65_004583 [Bradyrhizobium sp. CIR18]|uniref:hypothetical protein n=1 Tax=Bradyrhizobium sp. CIR18 TaxID=2663839 RepID=UPI0016058227|nr:hypothetical protein [Bradyrhizobium sp. CIR18]MBB4363538.1 hypothetical protein [Bradyrhizobium sp. CIR18]